MAAMPKTSALSSRMYVGNGAGIIVWYVVLRSVHTPSRKTTGTVYAKPTKCVHMFTESLWRPKMLFIAGYPIRLPRRSRTDDRKPRTGIR